MDAKTNLRDRLQSLTNRADEAYNAFESSIDVSDEDLATLNELLQLLDQLESNKSKEPEKASKLPQGFFDNPLALTSKDIEGLPEAVLKELSELDPLEVEILDLLKLAGGTLVLDKVIAGLYHMTGDLYPRHLITAKLYRMSKKGLVFSVPKKKGVYSTTNPEEDEAWLK